MKRSWQIGLGLLVVHCIMLPVAAQAESIQGQPLPLPVRTHLFQPDLPPIRPSLPEGAEIRLLLKLKQRRVYVYDGDRLTKSYPVAVGKAGWETPIGQFRVTSMLRNPGWTNPFTGEVLPPGGENPLGDRWIAFWTDGQNDIGFHGTPNRESVGQPASHGCVRMLNEDIRELFEWVQPGTIVTVEP